ncbi:hypothetical protein ACJX0J_018642, partial [Zea mays]
ARDCLRVYNEGHFDHLAGLGGLENEKKIVVSPFAFLIQDEKAKETATRKM